MSNESATKEEQGETVGIFACTCFPGATTPTLSFSFEFLKADQLIDKSLLLSIFFYLLLSKFPYFLYSFFRHTSTILYYVSY